MMLSATQYFYIAIAFALSLLIHYLVIQLSIRSGYFLDEGEKIQKAHVGATPRIGGLGIFLACMFILNDAGVGGYLMLAAIPAFVAGFLEDYSGKVSPLQRLAIMALSPIMVIVMLPDNIWIDSFAHMPYVIGLLGGILFIVAIINGVNFTDGQNGLASGTVLISFLAMLVLAIERADSSLTYMCLVVCAAIISFLIFNYPAGKIFLGDGGAYLLGFLLASLSLVMIHEYGQYFSPLLLLIIVIYPLWEVIFSTFRKILLDHISPLRSDDFHLHQLLFRNRAAGGKGHRPALFILPVQLVITAVALWFSDNTLILTLLIFSYLSIYCFVYFYERNYDRVQQKSNLS